MNVTARHVLAPILAVASVGVCSASDWSLINSGGIQQPDGSWISGRICDFLPLGNGQQLVASDYSGVWLIPGAGQAVPLSRSWPSTVTYSLAADSSRHDHIFAGGQTNIYGADAVLYETNSREALPLLAPWVPVTLPLGMTTIRRVLVTQNPARIVIASDSGLYWAPIPATPGPYHFQQAIGGNSAMWDVKEGPNSTIVVGVKNYSAAPSTSPILIGGWSGTGASEFLGLSTVRIHGNRTDPCNLTTFGTTSVAAFQGDKRIMVAACSDRVAGRFEHLLSSVDGGHNWAPKLAVTADGKQIGLAFEGRQGLSDTNCVAISPTDRNHIVVGWVKLEISHDGGNTFTENGGLHDDHHTVTFKGTLLYDCSDAGLITTADDGKSFSSTFAQKIPNLIFYPYFDSAPALSSQGILVGCGLQDHLPAYCTFSSVGALTPWRMFQGYCNADGGPICFLSKGAAWPCTDGTYHYSSSNPDSSMSAGAPMNVVGAAKGDNVLAAARLFHVPHSTFRNSRGGQLTGLLSTVAPSSVGSGLTVHLFGIFDEGGGSPADIESLKDLPMQSGGTVASLGSFDGHTIYLGSGPIPTLDAVSLDTGAITHQTGIATAGGGYVDHLTFAGNHDAFAVVTNGLFSSMYQMVGDHNWVPVRGVPRGLITSVVFATPSEAYLSTESKVYASHNDRSVWTLATSGLPNFANCSQLSVAQDRTGKRWLTLGTFGWSAWKLPLN